MKKKATTPKKNSSTITFHAIDHAQSRSKGDLLVLPFWKASKIQPASAETQKLHALYESVLQMQDFQAKEGEVLFLYVPQLPEQRLILLGLGEQEKVTTEKLRRAYGSLAKTCQSKKIKALNLFLPHISGLGEQALVKGVTEGLLLANYSFSKYYTDPQKEIPTLLTDVSILGISKKGLEAAQKYALICDGVYLARNLVNDNADEITAAYLGTLAKKIAIQYPRVKTTVWDRKRIEKEKMGLLLAVNRGSSHDPAFIIIEYKGNPKSKDHTVIVGKGITYDTGGLNLKPSTGMETMKCDMAGAALAFGVVVAAANIGLKVNFTVIIPATENSIGPMSYKTGDVYVSYSGKTVEVNDTDAEGRLVLADALAYAEKNLKPTRIIDFATLTGGVGIALGWEASGLMSNDDALSDSLIRASSETFERLWRLPLYEEYQKNLKSDIADMKNSGGRFPSSINGGMFLKEFVGKTPWAHCDIAYTAYLDEPRRYLPKHATGVGVRLMIEFFENLNT